jgi:phosphatidylglycerophosphatase A
MRQYTVPELPDTLWQNPLHFIAFGFGSGAIPMAPGTFGTLFAIPFYLAIQHLSPLHYLIVLMIIIIFSCWLCEKVSREIAADDHQGMCLDEFVGFLVTMFAAPSGWQWILLGFILFRIFDIWKPQPIRYLDEHVHGGIGMILDDVAAGVVSALLLQFLAWII